MVANYIQMSTPRDEKRSTKVPQEEIDYKARLSAILGQKASNTAPVQHWSQGATRLVEGLNSQLYNRQAVDARAQNADIENQNKMQMAQMVGGNEQQQDFLTSNPDVSKSLIAQKLMNQGKPVDQHKIDYVKSQTELNRTKAELLRNPDSANNLNGFKDKKQRLGAQGDFRKEFTKVSGDFIKVRDAQSRIEASAKDPSAAGDLALIFNYMKVLDPGSTVREGEFATAQNAAGIPARMRAQLNSVLSGQRLADTQRGDFVKRSRLLFGRQEQQYNKTRKIYENIARRNGLDVESVLPDYSTSKQPPDIVSNSHIKSAVNPKTGERALFDTRTGQRVK